MESRIKELRIEKGLTQKELAKRTDLSERQIRRIETNETNPNGTTLNTLKSIAKALETTIAYLLNEG